MMVRLYHATTVPVLKRILKSGTIKGMWTPYRSSGKGGGTAKYWASFRYSETWLSPAIIRAEIPREILTRTDYGYYKVRRGERVTTRRVTGVWVWDKRVLRWMFYKRVSDAVNRRRGTLSDV